MAAVGNPRTWIPYMNSKDCSEGFCSLYCPQWCYIVYPPPPPFEYPDDDSGPNFSPLVIAIIGILATAFLLVSYYTLISKYCGLRESPLRDPNDELQENHNHNQNHEPCHASTTGLDESLIKSIAVFKYKKGYNRVTDCSVCLSEFQDNESVRLLPKCSHVFHLPCIDTWLKSHSTCPLCRACIFTSNASVPAPEVENETSSENEFVVVVEEESMHHARAYPKPALRAFSDLSSFQGRHRVIEIRDGACESFGMSESMDHSFQSVAHVLQLQMNQVQGCSTEAGPSKRSQRENSKSSRYKTRVLHCVLSPIAMKRSFSSGRLSITKSGRGRHGTIPISEFVLC
ncbi:E3 ubiquitin-protein ligase Os04g0590900 [Cajanus cajan]|uniref:RING-type E3 ubiquitin transferase n=1 Tax=Cajanus cajan TaxID=3821 RepID=A0A151R834_CAJCA|nr:E3 ubiquitin-protein ligase Os04g0590900 [Cajanus cajan]XP_020203719.1 E3 ubiquitin-protein ligase Os04g0590900 [Cajanus cajan]KYP38712.1 RING-H2 finger protein ATL3A [Cajanus cajan]